jgi:hypothetical protein
MLAWTVTVKTIADLKNVQAASRGGWFERHPKKTILAVVLVAASAVDLVCGALIIPANEGEPNYYYHHGLKTNFRGTLVWGKIKYPAYTDSLGFKDSSNHIRPLVTSKRRILFMGDSFTEGMGMPYEKTFVGMIARRMDPSTYDIVNSGASSWSPKLYYLRAKYLIENGLKFDDLYVYIDISDAEDEITYSSFHSAGHPTSDYYLRKTRAWLGDHSAVFWLKNQLFGRTSSYYTERALWTVNDAIYNKWGAKGVVLEREYMDELERLCKRTGITLHIAVYPWPQQIQYRDLNSKQVTVWREFSQARSLEFINYFPDFINDAPAQTVIDRYFIPGDVHWTPAGHELIASKWLRLHQ